MVKSEKRAQRPGGLRGAGFHDLMVHVDNDAVFSDGKQAELGNFLIRLGYDAVAYNISASAPLVKQHRCQIKPCPVGGDGETGAADKRPPSPARAALRLDGKAAFQQVTRLTVAVEDASHVHAVEPSNEIAGTYDLLAVRPLSERVFELACKSMKVDIISLDLSHRLNFYLKIPLIKAAMARGIYFEITYAPCLRDTGARRTLFGNALQLVRATRGHNLLLSSEADRCLELRSPHDVINLSNLFGLGHGGKGQAAMDSNPAAVIRLARERRGISTSTAAVTAMSRLSEHDQKALQNQISVSGRVASSGVRAGVDDDDFVAFGDSDGDGEGDEEEAESRAGGGAEAVQVGDSVHPGGELQMRAEDEEEEDEEGEEDEEDEDHEEGEGDEGGTKEVQAERVVGSKSKVRS